jgi:predicted small secreted protein
MRIIGKLVSLALVAVAPLLSSCNKAEDAHDQRY